MAKLRILHIIPSLVKGGAERLAIDICNNLQKQDNLEVKLLTFRETNEYSFLTQDISHSVVDASLTPSISGNWKVNLGPYLEFIESYKPNIIHSHLFEAEMITRYQIDPDIMYVTHLHDNMVQFEPGKLDTLKSKRAITNYYEKTHLLKLYRKCNNNFIAISEDVKSYFEKSIPSFINKITLKHNAIDTDRFLNNKRITNLDPNKVTRLINVGGLVEKKNQTFLLDVIKHLKNQGLNIVLDLLGEGPERGKIEERIKNEALENEVILHGNVNEVETYLRDSDIYVHSALYEPFGLVLLEAMASGLPVIALDGKGNRDIVVNGEVGFLESGSSLEYAHKINLLMNDSALYARMSVSAVDLSRNFDIKAYVQDLIQYYHSLST